MKLGDFFLPKIARSDPEVRKEAVLGETDEQLLRTVSEKDESEEVRVAARQRLRELSASTV